MNLLHNSDDEDQDQDNYNGFNKIKTPPPLTGPTDLQLNRTVSTRRVVITTKETEDDNFIVNDEKDTSILRADLLLVALSPMIFDYLQTLAIQGNEKIEDFDPEIDESFGDGEEIPLDNFERKIIENMLTWMNISKDLLKLDFESQKGFKDIIKQKEEEKMKEDLKKKLEDKMKTTFGYRENRDHDLKDQKKLEKEKEEQISKEYEQHKMIPFQLYYPDAKMKNTIKYGEFSTEQTRPEDLFALLKLADYLRLDRFTKWCCLFIAEDLNYQADQNK